ncbi:MAG: molybdopterin-dependent oxidoreductase [Ardenticatenales bacterium]|nr:molybdopterin-dependent oxidoreductase [Ardenticatenales bacterium]
MDHEHDTLRPHSHDPNLQTPTGDGTFVLSGPNGSEWLIVPADLQRLPQATVANCYIVSTGHGTSGPFTFGGVRLLDLIQAFIAEEWSEVEVISADGFGNRLLASELYHPDPAGPILLAHTLDSNPMTREQGLVRLIVPSERDDALRQVKWVARGIVRH